MEVSEEKLSELAKSFEKLRVFKNEEGQLYIRENALGAYESLCANMSIIKENFKYFAKCRNSVMYPDEFIMAIKFLPNGSEILADNLEYILTEIKHGANRARQELIGIPEVSEKVANDFENIFNLMIYGEKLNQDKSSATIDPAKKHFSYCSVETQGKFSVLMTILKDSEKAGEVLENNKKLFLNSNFNSAMADMVRILAENPECHEFIRSNFFTIKENCYISDLAKLYSSIKDIYPEEYEKQSFVIDKIYKSAKENCTNLYSINQIEKICSRIIEQGKSEDIRALAEIAMQNSTIEPNTIKYLGAGWFNIAIQAGDKVIKLEAPDDKTEKSKIPYHPRLLQPIVRKCDITKDSEHPLGIEIYEVVDMDTEISDEEILEVYKELREAGIKWTDIKKENLGRLRKDNYPYEFGYNVPLPPEMLGIEDSGVERKILKAGQVVIIDLDYLELAENEKGSSFTNTSVIPECVRKYELEYQKRIKSERQEKIP